MTSEKLAFGSNTVWDWRELYLETTQGKLATRSVSLAYSVALQALKPKSSP
jgi:hypothetical protein